MSPISYGGAALVAGLLRGRMLLLAPSQCRHHVWIWMQLIEMHEVARIVVRSRVSHFICSIKRNNLLTKLCRDNIYMSKTCHGARLIRALTADLEQILTSDWTIYTGMLTVIKHSHFRETPEKVNRTSKGRFTRAVFTARVHGRQNLTPVFTGRVHGRPFCGPLFTVVRFVAREHGPCWWAVLYTHFISAVFGRHFACKVDEFNKKKKLLFLATSLSITAYIRRKNKRSCWTRTWLLRRVEQYAGTRVVYWRQTWV